MSEQFSLEFSKQSLVYINEFLEKFRSQDTMNILNFITYPEIANLYISLQRLDGYLCIVDSGLTNEIAKQSITFVIQFFERLRTQTQLNIMKLFDYSEITKLYMATFRINTYLDNKQTELDNLRRTKNEQEINNSSDMNSDMNTDLNIHTI